MHARDAAAKGRLTVFTTCDQRHAVCESIPAIKVNNAHLSRFVWDNYGLLYRRRTMLLTRSATVALCHCWRRSSSVIRSERARRSVKCQWKGHDLHLAAVFRRRGESSGTKGATAVERNERTIIKSSNHRGDKHNTLSCSALTVNGRLTRSETVHTKRDPKYQTLSRGKEPFNTACDTVRKF